MARRALKSKPSRDKRVPDPVDKHVGSRVRIRRLMMDMSQEKLGQGIGLTFQQIQKYEKGANRIGAGRLQQISSVLQVPVSFFFEGAPVDPTQAGAMKDAPFPAYVSEFLSMPGGLDLTRAFVKIKDKKWRQRIVVLVDAISNIPSK
jgi:transcriptional regulator with XRE-family HTH domain